ncbi:hypothetical protein QCM77_16260 [Bradyrhizobium sp. SSUT18]|uniref:hypothetical protein n=1 Tax=unclassified Bradyrhizobium TaxID=2631580 RepID=UPI00244A89B0|nr:MULTISPECIES: hypothetical protein [unclassified Bradyrhizobium]MDH2350620.1 hypothetical protein [Bradyrhizobium sp. SSUT112]MDH2401496.1 hypothetical protein [Bradyrhizobium sp. SSUT18]
MVLSAFGLPTPRLMICLLRPGHADENVLIALGVDLVTLDVLLLLADEAAQLVQLKALGAHADHDAVVQFHAAHDSSASYSAATVAAG